MPSGLYDIIEIMQKTQYSRHICAPDLSKFTNDLIGKLSKAEGLKNPFKSSLECAREAVQTVIKPGAPDIGRRPDFLVGKNVNRKRAKQRPALPKADTLLTFEIHENSFPSDFF